MKVAYQFLFYFFLGVAAIMRPRASPQSAINTNLITFAIQEHRAPEVFQALAQQAKIVIGVSGELVGSDSKHVSIAANKLTLDQVLDEICTKDPRYKWHKTVDGNVGVTVGKKPLELVDMVLRHIEGTHMRSTNVATTISQLPEVKAWADTTKCNVGQVIMGRPSQNTWDLNIDLSSGTLSKLLNEMAAQRKTYFWSVVKFSEHPCEINLEP